MVDLISTQRTDDKPLAATSLGHHGQGQRQSLPLTGTNWFGQLMAFYQSGVDGKKDASSVSTDLNQSVNTLAGLNLDELPKDAFSLLQSQGFSGDLPAEISDQWSSEDWEEALGNFFSQLSSRDKNLTVFSAAVDADSANRSLGAGLVSSGVSSGIALSRPIDSSHNTSEINAQTLDVSADINGAGMVSSEKGSKDSISTDPLASVDNDSLSSTATFASDSLVKEGAVADSNKLEKKTTADPKSVTITPETENSLVSGGLEEVDSAQEGSETLSESMLRSENGDSSIQTDAKGSDRKGSDSTLASQSNTFSNNGEIGGLDDGSMKGHTKTDGHSLSAQANAMMSSQSQAASHSSATASQTNMSSTHSSASQGNFQGSSQNSSQGQSAGNHSGQQPGQQSGQQTPGQLIQAQSNPVSEATARLAAGREPTAGIVFNDLVDAQSQRAEKTERVLGDLGLGMDRKSSLPLSLQAINVSMRAPQWGQAMGHRVVYMATNKIQEAKITLNPENLGPVKVKIQIDKDQQVNVSMTAQHGTTRESLENALPRLKEMLEEAGIAFGSLDVSTQSESDSEAFADEENAQQKGASSTTGMGAEENENPEKMTIITESDNLVDYYA